tara:strand:+ start:810 stop:2309 length:1500 start_codon:yes stop_codon:yes gene_type:complete
MKVRLFSQPLSMALILTFLLYVSVANGEAVSVKASTPHPVATQWPDRIIATPTVSPADSFSVTWRTDNSVNRAYGEIVQADSDARYDINAAQFVAKTNNASLAKGVNNQEHFRYQANEGLPNVHYHSLTFKDLQADTYYNYRVAGATGMWSPWQQIKTAPIDTNQDFSFLYFGDAQNGIYSHWPLVLRRAWQHAPNAKFAIYAGDLVNEGASDQQWSNWLNAGQFIHRTLPAVLVAGNHEYDWQVHENAQKTWALSTLWQSQFTLPLTPALPSALQETAYVTHYPEMDIFVLDSEARGDINLLHAQAQWLDQALQTSTAKWRIVTMHHPIFSSCGMPLNSPGQDEPEIRAAFLPIMLKHKVDLVLQGHDHAYARGSIGTQNDINKTAIPSSKKQVKTVFVTSVAGPKTYPIKPTRWDEYRDYGVTLERIGENTPTYQIISKTTDNLIYQSFTSDGQIYDEFTLRKNTHGNKTLSVAKKLPPQRTFKNTGLYKSHHDLAE